MSCRKKVLDVPFRRLFHLKWSKTLYSQCIWQEFACLITARNILKMFFTSEAISSSKNYFYELQKRPKKSNHFPWIVRSIVELSNNILLNINKWTSGCQYFLFVCQSNLSYKSTQTENRFILWKNKELYSVSVPEIRECSNLLLVYIPLLVL